MTADSSQAAPAMKQQALLLLMMAATQCVSGQVEEATCRFYNGTLYPPSVFNSLSCCHCYHILFEVISPYGVGFCNFTNLRIENGEDTSLSYESDPNDSIAVSGIRKLVGNNLLAESWKQCCTAARSCCKTMDEKATQRVTQLSNESDVECPATWDMFSCWEPTHPNRSVTQMCPHHLTTSLGLIDCTQADIHYSHRHCNGRGVWDGNISEGIGESDYSRCSEVITCLTPLQEAKHIIEVTFECVSIAALLPAIIIFITYRSLRDQQRIRLHINLFVSIFFYHLIHLIYETTVRRHDIVGEVGEMNSMSCRVLNALTKYSVLSMYMWMLLEGFYLHWLMVNTFNQPKLIYFIISGWGTPLVLLIAFVLAKSLTPISNTSCWLRGDTIDWIINVPLILCLALNLVFLINIQRVILTQLQVHQNEPSFYRRAVKATAILVPPFGLVLVVTLYSPSPEANMKTRLIYDCVAAAFLHVQGLLISIILCYSNAEVLGHLKRSLRNTCLFGGSLPYGDTSMATNITNVSRRRSSATNHSTVEAKSLLQTNGLNGTTNNNQLLIDHDEKV